MSDKNRERQTRAKMRSDSAARRGRSTAMRLFDAGVRESAAAYVRARDLPRLVALWPHELEDQSPEGALRVLAKLRQALRAERVRARGGHWSYDLNRHLGLLSAYRAELARLGQRPPGQPKRANRCGARPGARRRP